jgi:tRNA(Ile2) C34 agmatinyltransferase TiaS
VRVPGLKKLKYRLRVRGRRKSKVVRVAGARVDQLVTCPSCGQPMRLSELGKFTCGQCKRELTAEQVLTALEFAGT